MTPPKKISHVGIAVKNLEETLPFYTDVLGLTLEGYETVESEMVRVAFLTIGETRLELLEATSSESPIAKFIEKKGEGIHHIAFQIEEISDQLQTLKSQEIRLIHEVPKDGAHHSLVAFLHPKSSHGVLVELCEPQTKQNER
ncbi:methylmalonyl-CoA epimerase [Ammoniphilus resinae]|uniref:methylmalonyl-CoA epimerase n=1 Tax=Ammoniphilus resinae TaxID=861532 RepID=UPI001AE9F644